MKKFITLVFCGTHCFYVIRHARTECSDIATTDSTSTSRKKQGTNSRAKRQHVKAPMAVRNRGKSAQTARSKSAEKPRN
jgi:hypothetical protein